MNQEQQENKEFVEKNGRAFSAHEGICLHCYAGDTDFVRAEGVPDFLDRFNDEGVRGREWDPEADQFGEQGVFIYHCKACGKDTEVYQLVGGDQDA